MRFSFRRLVVCSLALALGLLLGHLIKKSGFVMPLVIQEVIGAGMLILVGVSIRPVLRRNRFGSKVVDVFDNARNVLWRAPNLEVSFYGKDEWDDVLDTLIAAKEMAAEAITDGILKPGDFNSEVRLTAATNAIDRAIDRVNEFRTGVTSPEMEERNKQAMQSLRADIAAPAASPMRITPAS
jgi:hypothetical protein